MENTRCKTCGGSIERNGNYYICEYCDNKWEIDSSDDVHVVERANAWSALRDGDFEKATQSFENVILKDNNNHEAYWGRALATNGIVYVNDMSERKKVPTCNNITEESFVKSKDVQQAISLAPNDIAETYRKQADYIEKIRIEWLEKASKEPEYDIFISFKDSDRENGIERTQDSVDAQDLYNALIAEGYKVFFSRISLRDKISEQYEPYIYNAIKTAKIMIVFGEKPEYFNSVWIKNEWSRYKTRIEKGEKHKNSLVVVYKNINPADLPVVLKTRQCLNAADMTFLSDLNRHIQRVIAESKKKVTLEKIEIAGGQIAKKATTLSVNSVQIREVGQGAIAETSISEQQSISLIRTYLSEKQWREASSLADDILFNNPTCAEAEWFKLLATYQVTDNESFAGKLKYIKQNTYPIIEKILNCASKTFAEEILIFLYSAGEDIPGPQYKILLDKILPYAFDKREEMISQAFESVITGSKYEPFTLLLNTLEQTEVDKYIDYNYRYALRTINYLHKKECLNNVLAVDEGNINALHAIVKNDLSTSNKLEVIIQDFERLLKYTADINKEVLTYLEWMSSQLSTSTHCDFAMQILRYYTEGLKNIKKQLIAVGYRMLQKGFFKEGEYFLNLVLSFEQDEPNAFWGICLAKVGAKSEEDIVSCDTLIKDIPEFNKYLTFVAEERRRECIRISKEQAERIEEEVKLARKLRKEELDQKRKALYQQQGLLIKRREESTKGGVSVIMGTLSFALLTIACYWAGKYFWGTVCLLVEIILLFAVAEYISERKKAKKLGETIEKIGEEIRNLPRE